MSEIGNKIRQVFGGAAVYKEPNNNSLFAGRNLPSFIKDYLLSSHINAEGELDRERLTQFLDAHIPADNSAIKMRLLQGETLTLLTRFIVSTNLTRNRIQFSIPDMGIKASETSIPPYLAEQHPHDLIDGEHWGILKILYITPDTSNGVGYVEMANFKPFRPMERLDIDMFKACRQQFTLNEWIDVLLSAMEYNPKAFESITQKLEFLSRLLPFIEPRLNMIELAPKGTGKSYVYSRLSKFVWLVSGGKVTRAKLFYDNVRQIPGIMRFYDLVAFDEIQTISFSDSKEMQSSLKTYLESGKTTVGHYEFISECGLMLLGNIKLGENGFPLSHNYLEDLPEHFKESALLDRFHGFIEGWLLPRVNVGMAIHDWSINVEFFSEMMHQLRTSTTYAEIVNELLQYPKDTDMRHIVAVKRMATAYLKLLFPQVKDASEIDKEAFNLYCLQPSIRRRDIIRAQCSLLDKEASFSKPMPKITLRSY